MTVETGAPRFLNVPASAWAFALRTWAAMMVALYIAFWLQLPSGDVGAVTVGLLAAPTRGPTIARAILRVGGTAAGAAAAIALAGLFNGTRTPFLGALAVWLAVCAFVAGLLDDRGAYVAALGGFTVAIVALPNIDAPLNTFASAVDRGASIVLGLAVLAVMENVLAVPGSLSGLQARLAALHGDVRRAGAPAGRCLPPGELAALCGRLTALRAAAYALPVESIAGRVRAAAARRALASLAALLWESRMLAGARAADGPASIAEFRAHKTIVEEALRSLASGRGATNGPVLPVARTAAAAARDAARVLAIFAAAAIFYVVSGLPQTTDGLLHVAIYICVSMILPNPRVYALATVLATAAVIPAVGITEFLILDGVDAFPLLAIGLFPMVVGAGLLRAAPSPLLSAMGTRMLVFSIFILSPGLSQSYDPQHYLSESLEVLIGALIFAAGWSTVLPVHPAARRRWLLDAARAACDAERRGWDRADVEQAYWWADIVAQMGRLTRSGGSEAELDEACRLADAAWRARRSTSTE